MKYPRRLITTVLLSVIMLPALAHGKADSTYTFRFVAGEDMFYVPWHGNENELARLLECVGRFRDEILGGRMPLYVDGYCSSQPTKAKNLALAKIRSNRVKSELIIRQKITEDCFVTRNHAAEGDYVVVRVKIPSNLTAPSNLPHEGEAMDGNASDNMGGKASGNTQAESDGLSLSSAGEDKDGKASGNTQPESDGLSLPRRGEVGGGFALRVNLLRWATLTPDLGIEWRVCPSWGIAVNGSWTSWSWSDKKRRYALWEVMPEVRYYIGKNKRGYLGAMFKTGEFNYKLSGTGKQGDLIGGGITGGYQLRLNKALALDFNLGLGYLNADYEKYEVVDGVRVRRGNETKDWWGPINAGVTLVWKLF